MKINLVRSILLITAILFAASSGALAQGQLGRRKGPDSKLYLAETAGETQIQNGDKLYTARQATAFDATGTVIETKENSHNALVYSNGTGLFIDESTRIEVTRFVQEPFKPDQTTNADVLLEPSISHSEVLVSRGTVGVCTSQLLSGSSMTYSTSHASVNIRGGKATIETSAGETTVDLLEGDLTVRSGGNDIGGQILRAGERAVIRPGAAGQPATVNIGPIPPEALGAVDQRTSVACNARKTVSFEVIEKKAAAGPDGLANFTSSDGAPGEIVAKPTVPESPPFNIVVSPDRLPGT